ncbi:unnamed protein product [Heligmosomoides polygyrus]|uniref:PID domain-containing protein n=1 Tax=Heligmosomoides polygyrus TaxID=6339 RepID=A0A183GRG2_HELPZ|nr:unnamed protein product [Heligmosomoides polygyrus]
MEVPVMDIDMDIATRTARNETPSPVPISSHQPMPIFDPEHEELLMSDSEYHRYTAYCRVRYPDVDDHDLFDDEDNSQSSQSSLSQSSFGAPITPMPARKRFYEERAETHAETEPYSKRSRYDELPCLEFGVCLDRLRLGMRELSCPVSVIALRRNPTPFWLSLGDTDDGAIAFSDIIDRH